MIKSWKLNEDFASRFSYAKIPFQAISEVREEADQRILHTITHLVTCQWLKTTPIIPSVACYLTTGHAGTPPSWCLQVS